MNEKNNKRLCPGCGASNGRLIGSKSGFEILACADCRTIYTSVAPSSEPTEEYEDYYTEANLNVPDFIRMRAGEIVNDLSDCRSNNRMLDIGFGSGVIMDAAREQGWQSYGIEVSAPAVEQARDKGFEVFHGTLEDAKYPNGHFDLVTASEILEHIHDPQATLNEIARILRPGGKLWGTTPSATGLSYRLMGVDWSMIVPPDHTQLFSAKAIRDMLGHAGFKNVIIKTHSVAPGEIVHFFRNKKSVFASNEETHNRLESAYELNESLTRSPLRRFIKNGLNATLNTFGLGDSLKIFATT